MPVIDYNGIPAPSNAPHGALWRQPGESPNVYINTSLVAGVPVWDYFGNIDSPHLGWARSNGFAAEGAITGATGLAHGRNAALTGSPLIEGKAIATVDDLSAGVADMIARMTAIALGRQQGIAATIGGDKSLVAIDAGLLFPKKESDYVITIPLPYYRDSAGQVVARASQSECRWIVGFGYGRYATYRPMTDERFGMWDVALNDVDPTTVLTFKAGRKSSTGMIDVNTSDRDTFAVGYFIVGVKS